MSAPVHPGETVHPLRCSGRAFGSARAVRVQPEHRAGQASGPARAPRPAPCRCRRARGPAPRSRPRATSATEAGVGSPYVVPSQSGRRSKSASREHAVRRPARARSAACVVLVASRAIAGASSRSMSLTTTPSTAGVEPGHPQPEHQPGDRAARPDRHHDRAPAPAGLRTATWSAISRADVDVGEGAEGVGAAGGQVPRPVPGQEVRRRELQPQRRGEPVEPRARTPRAGPAARGRGRRPAGRPARARSRAPAGRRTARRPGPSGCRCRRP